MEAYDNARLDAATWFDGIARLSARMEGDARLENCLRHAFHLAALTPPPFDRLTACPMDEEAFEQLLERGAWETAVAALVGETLRHEIVARGAREAGARVWLEGQSGEARVRASSPARALALAWCAFLLNLAPGGTGQPGGASHKSA